jgi:hypothetical protein
MRVQVIGSKRLKGLELIKRIGDCLREEISNVPVIRPGRSLGARVALGKSRDARTAK